MQWVLLSVLAMTAFERYLVYVVFVSPCLLDRFDVREKKMEEGYFLLAARALPFNGLIFFGLIRISVSCEFVPFVVAASD